MAEDFRIKKYETNNGMTDTRFVPASSSTVSFSAITIADGISATSFSGDGSSLTNITTGTETITVGENVVSGDILYLNTDGKYWKASNTGETTSSTELRIANATILADASGAAIAKGPYTTTGLSTGVTYWLGDGGAYTSTQPTGDGNIVRYIGTPLSDTVLEFNPDETYIEITTGTGGGVSQPAFVNVTTSYSILTTDYTVNVTTTGDTTQTLPTAVGVQGKIYNVKNSDTTSVSTITLATTSSQTIDGYSAVTFNFPDNITVQSDGGNWIII
jgi:hypothetical protein